MNLMCGPSKFRQLLGHWVQALGNSVKVSVLTLLSEVPRELSEYKQHTNKGLINKKTLMNVVYKSANSMYDQLIANVGDVTRNTLYVVRSVTK